MHLKFIINKYYDKKFVSDKKTLDYIEREYKNSIEQLEKSRKEYQESWDSINNKFSNSSKLLILASLFFNSF